MKPLKKEIDAVAAALEQPHESAQQAAAAAIEAIDQARAERVMYVAAMRFEGPVFIGLGPFSTKNQAQKAIEKHPAAAMVRGWAVVPTINGEGYEALLTSIDRPAESRGDWAEVAKDRQARKNGWKGKSAVRERYL
jgi:hypothetical protein